MKKWFRNFIIGRNAHRIPSEAEFKRVILRGNLALVGLFVGFSYIFIDHYNGVYGNEAYYVTCGVISLATLFLIRAGKYMLSTVLFLSAMGLLIFFFSASDSYQTGVYIFFIASSLTSFALFGYTDRKLALLYVGISLILFSVAYWTDHRYIAAKALNPEYIKLSYTMNFVVALVTCTAIVYFLIDVNFHSEKQILAKNDELAKANAELDRFVYSASHDMRAPLSSILGLVQVYQLSDNTEEKNKVIGLIRNRANKLDDFIREILDYSRNARLAVNPVLLHPLDLVHEIVEGLRYFRDFEKIKIDITATDNHPVMADGERLKVILNNLTGNALKYYDPYKQQPRVGIFFMRTDSAWSITVTDNGIGIHPDHQKRVFEMFYRAHDNSEGSGLGLYIAQEAAVRMGGGISVSSVHGEGSVFKLEFPAAVTPS